MEQKIVTTAAGTAFPARVAAGEVVDFHDPIVNLLRARLGRAHAELLARPGRQPDGSIVWSTALTGECRPATDLAADDREALKRLAERRLGDIAQLGREMEAESGTARQVAQMLTRVVMLPPGHWLYSLDGRPVLVMWGHADTAAAAAPIEAGVPGPGGPAAAFTERPMSALDPADAGSPSTRPAATAAAGAATAAAAAAPDLAGKLNADPATDPATVAAQATATRRRQPAWLVAVFALLLLLAAGLAWLLACGDQCRPTSQAATPDALTRDIAAADAHNADLSRALTERLAKEPSLICLPNPSAQPAEPPPPAAQAQAPSPPEPEPEPPPPAPPEPPPAPPPAPKPTPKPPPRQAATPPPKMSELCPGDRPAEQSPQLALVFDASRSMAWGLHTTASDEENFNQIPGLALLEGLTGRRGPATAANERLNAKPDRLSLAKAASVSMVRNVPTDVDIGLVVLEDDCPSARSYGFVPPSQRGALISKIQRIEATGATPLADGLEKAGRMVDGVKREALIVVVSDGSEACKRDPCAVAAALARAKPKLRINVVDILGKGAGNCLAAATKGKVFTASKAADVTTMMDRATSNALAPDSCQR